MSHPSHDGYNPAWTCIVPLISCLFLAGFWFLPNLPGLTLLLSLGLIGSVVTAVHHAEVIALKVGEPFGTLVLALSVTIIEVALIISMMISGGEAAMALPRDTIFAALMIILNGIIGASLLVGGQKNGVQQFNLEGITDALCTTTVIVVLALVLPNYVMGTAGASYTSSQLVFVAVATLVLFAAFTLFQTMQHRDYFVYVPSKVTPPDVHDVYIALPDSRTTWMSGGFLVISLIAVVLSAKGISPALESLLGRWGAPAATLGIVIATIVLLPEFGAAMRAARNNRLQSSLNLAIGSAIASMGLTIPAVALVALFMGWPLELGLDGKSTVLLTLSLFVVALSLRTGNTTTQPGIVHLVIFVTYLFFSFFP